MMLLKMNMQAMAIAATRQVLAMMMITVIANPNTPTIVGKISVPHTIEDNVGEPPGLGNERLTKRPTNSSVIEQARIVCGTAAAAIEADMKICIWMPRRAST
jgi:hypothetical protein